MAYVFDKQEAASFKFQGKTAAAYNGALTLNGVSGSQQNAATVITGIQGLLYIGNLIGQYDPLDGIRTVKENVDNDE